MAVKDQLPGFVEKRKALYSSKTPPQRMREIGERFLAAGRRDEALDFLTRCGATDAMQRIAAEALADGNVPLYMRAMRALRQPIDDAAWTQVAAAAEAAGRFTMAYVAHVKAGHDAESARLRALIPGLEEAEQARAAAQQEAEIREPET